MRSELVKRLGFVPLVSAACGIFFLTGCATVTGGTRTNVSIESEPEGATATIGTVQCETPCTMSVARDASDIRIDREGYEPLNLELDKSFRAVPTILGNIIWLIPGLAVDFIAGGAWDVRPVNVELRQADDGNVLEVELLPKSSQKGDDKAPEGAEEEASTRGDEP